MGTPDGPSDKLLFAMLSVELDFASASAVARAASGSRSRTVAEFADGLVKASVLTAEQRRSVEKAMEKSAAQRAAARSAAPGLAGRGDDDGAELPFEHEGRYEIRSVHGRGGQARVMLAYDRLMEREVALKVLREPGDVDPDPAFSSRRSTPGSLRFLREARVTGMLEHPNIIPVYEVGRREDGALYYAMRLVRGKTLAKALVESHGLQERLKRLGSFWDLCNAVAYAHSRGVVHRDLKPENAMVGEFGETVLLDWGVAKVRGERDLRARELNKELERMRRASADETTLGTAVGTPAYMSPEQAAGRVDEIDDRSDVWGLGALLYEILTGRPPFTGTSAAETLQKVLGEPLVPVRELSPEAPPELAAVAEKALQKEKERRYQSAQELAAEIDAFMTGGQVRAYEYTSWELVKRFAAQNKPTVGVAAALLVVILGSLLAVSLSLAKERQARERASEAHRQEAASRAKEYQERLSANYHLAQAYSEKADRLAADQLYLSASIYASASLLHNPAHPYSPFHSPDFAKSFPGSRNSRVAAASQIYRAGFNSIASLEQRLTTEGALEQVAFSPDGALLAATEGTRVRLWDLAGRRARPPLEGHSDRAYGVAFSPDGSLLATSGRDKTVVIWRAGSGERLQTFQGHADTVQSVAFSPDGRLLASAGWDQIAKIWDLASGRALFTLAGHKDRVTQVAFSPDGALVATGSYDRTVRLWNPRTGAALPQVLVHPDRVNSVAFSRDGRLVASACEDKRVHLWEVASGRLITAMPGHKDSPTQLAFSPDGTLLASVGYDKAVRLWDVELRQPVLNVAAHEDFAYGVAFSPDGATLATAGYDKRVNLWNVRGGKGVATLRGHSEVVYSVAFSPDGKLLASGGWDRTVRLWDHEAQRPLRTLAGHTDIVSGSIAFSPDGRSLASASADRTVRLWDTQTGETRHVLKAHSLIAYGVAFSPDGRLLATASMDKTIRLWDVESGKELRVLLGHDDVVRAVAFSPDGLLLASAGYDRTVRLWEAATGKLLRTLTGHKDWVSGAVFSPDGRMLASTGKDGLAIIWEVATGAELWRLRGHGQWVNAAQFSPDGRLLATASDDTTVRVWSTASLETLLIIPTSREAVGIAFSPDGKSLVIGDGAELKDYPLDFSALTADPTRLLTDAERLAGIHLEGFELKPLTPGAAAR